MEKQLQVWALLLVLSVRLSPLDIDPLLKPVASIKTFK